MKHLRRIVAFVSLLAMVAVFVAPSIGFVARLGWLPRIQLVPAILACSVGVLIALAISVALVGRLYCAVVCPLGISQDLVRGIARICRVPAARLAGGRALVIVRLAILALFIALCLFGFVGLLDPYGIFGRFLSAGVMRFGEPALLVTCWAIGLFGLIVLAGVIWPRAWCNAICPVGTFLGLFSRFALFRVRIDAAKCVRCGLCARACEAGAIAKKPDGAIAIDASRCVVCGNCSGTCAKGALKWWRERGSNP